MQLNDDDIAALVLREVSQAQGYESDVLASKRAAALQLYQGAVPAPPAAGTGRSGVVSRDVADSLHALQAQLEPVISSSLIEFPPESQDDVAGAQAESQAVRRVLERSDAYGTVPTVMADALLIGNGWVELDAREYDYTRRRSVALDTPPEALVGLPENAQIERTADALVITVTEKRKRLVVEAVPPEEMIFSNEPSCGDLQRLRLVGRRRYYTVAQLLAMGVAQEKVDACQDVAEADYPAQLARQGMYGQQYPLQAAQQANQLKLVHACWVMLDTADEGRTAERWYVLVGGDAVLMRERREYVPFVTGSGVPMPHRVQGVGVAELVAEVQLSKTETLRQYLDNLATVNLGRTAALEGDVKMEDLTNGRTNGVVRMRRPDAVMALPVPDVGPSALAGLAYMDQVRGQRVGASLDMTEVQAQMMSASATAAAGQMAQVEMMAGWIASNLVRTVLKPLYLLAHRMLRDMEEPVMVELAGQWQAVNPRDWPERQIADITMGLTSGQRIQRQQALQMVLGQQQGMLQQGMAGQLTDLSRYYNAMSDWVRASGLDDPAQYLIDPNSPQAQQAAQQQAQQQAQQAAQAQQQQQAMVQQQQQFELERQARELDYKRWSDKLKYEIDAAKVEAQSTLDALKLRDQRAESQANRDHQSAEGERARRSQQAQPAPEGGDEA